MNVWIQAARLRTLPLAFAVIILGSGMAMARGAFDPLVFTLALLLSTVFQVLSNYANDLGDGLRGTDANKKGEQRAVASGAISATAMNRAVNGLTMLAAVLVAVLTGISFDYYVWIITFNLLGAFAVWAARSYTMGKNPYAYWGGGDLFVIIFFGWVGVMGSELLFIQEPSPMSFFPATVAGLLSAAVLTLNNLRDQKGDKAAGKITLVVRYGEAWGRSYFKWLLIGAMGLNMFYAAFIYLSTTNLYPFAVQLLLGIAARSMRDKVKAVHNLKDFDPLLKPMAIITLLYCVLTAVALNL